MALPHFSPIAFYILLAQKGVILTPLNYCPFLVWDLGMDGYTLVQMDLN